ncbi:MAG: polysaccharide biosynthesis protein [Phycisphaerales bacterium]|nr:polysaccharide biosynthesis protein [Phycisphaerales bacterium]
MVLWNITLGRGGGFRRGVFNAGCRSGQAILLNVLSVPATAYIIRKLGPSGYGKWSTAVALVATVGVLTSLGLRGKFVRNVARDPRQAPRAFAEQMGTRLILGLLAGSAVVLAAFILHYPADVLRCVILAAIAMVAVTILTTTSDFMEAFQRFPAVAVASLVGGSMLTIASVLVVGLGGGPVALAGSYLVGPLLSAAILLSMLRRECVPVAIDIHPIKAIRILWTSRYFAAQQTLSVASNNVTLLLLPKLIGIQSFGLFAAGVLLVTRMAIVPDAMGTAFYPMIANLIGQDEKKARRHTLYGIAATVALCICISLTITILATLISSILLPKSQATCRQVIIITIWALPLMGIESMIGYAVNAAGRESLQARASFFATITSLTVGSCLVLRCGMLGACYFMLIRPAIHLLFTTNVFIQTFFFGKANNDKGCGKCKETQGSKPAMCLRSSPESKVDVAHENILPPIDNTAICAVAASRI